MILVSAIASLANEGASLVLDATTILPSSAVYIVSSAKPDATITFRNVKYSITTMIGILKSAKCRVVFDFMTAE